MNPKQGAATPGPWNTASAHDTRRRRLIEKPEIKINS